MKMVFGTFVDTIEKLYIPNQKFLEFKDTANHTFFNELQNNNYFFQ